MTDPCAAEVAAVLDADIALLVAQVNKLVADVELYVCRQNNPPDPPGETGETAMSADSRDNKFRVRVCDYVCKQSARILIEARQPDDKKPGAIAALRSEQKSLRGLFEALHSL